MKKFLIIVMAAMFAVSLSAQMRVWVGGQVDYEKDLSQIDSITFVKATDAGDTAAVNPNLSQHVFTVNAEGGQVYFSQGNLQYNAATNVWRFAENQYDYVGEDNALASSTYSGWIDLFGWGTSGWDNTANDPFAVNYQPWSTSRTPTNIVVSGERSIISINCEMLAITGHCDTVWSEAGYMYSNGVNTYGYGPSFNQTDVNLTGTSANHDWAVYNAIQNGGKEPGLWRTMLLEEWEYILNGRPLAQYLRSQATVCGVHGYILLPDDFTLPQGLTWSYKTNNWDTNTYNTETWAVMERAGAVFLPAAGQRAGVETQRFNQVGDYWTATYDYNEERTARRFCFNESDAAMAWDWRFAAFSIRPVQDVE